MTCCADIKIWLLEIYLQLMKLLNTSKVWIWHWKLNSYWHYWCQRWKLNSSFADKIKVSGQNDSSVPLTLLYATQTKSETMFSSITAPPNPFPSSTLCPHLCCNKMLGSIDQQLLVTWEETKHTQYLSWSDMCNLTFILKKQKLFYVILGCCCNIVFWYHFIMMSHY